MEFLRFGSSIPGAYWGCCACDIIQNFKFDPDAKASIQIVNGDGGHPASGPNGFIFAGPTWRDIFHQRIRFGTFDTRDMPNHGFIAILTDWQIKNNPGKQWLAILKEAGFEFIRTVSNSVYDEDQLSNSPSKGHPNYIFGLFRNIGQGCQADPFTPPKAWKDLPNVVPEAWERMDISQYVGSEGTTKKLAEAQRTAQREVWDKIGPAKLLSEAEVRAAGAPVLLAGIRAPGALQEAYEGARKDATPKGSAPKPQSSLASMVAA